MWLMIRRVQLAIHCLPGDWVIHYYYRFFKTSTDRCTQTAVDGVAMATSGSQIAEHTLVLAVKQSFVMPVLAELHMAQLAHLVL